MTIEQTVLARRLKEAREAAGLSQDEVAQSLGVPRPAISQIENANRRVAALELARLAKLYGKPMAFFSDEDVVDATRLDALHRTAKDLSDRDRDEVLRFAEYLRQKAEEGRKRR